MSIKDYWWRLRNRNSRKETVAFSLGMEVGAAISDGQRRIIDERTSDLY